MDYAESFEQAMEYAKSALTAMVKHGIPADPHNFTVWYTYYSGKQPDLCKAIDILQSNGEAFTKTLNEELYERYFRDGTPSEAFEKTGSRIEASIDKVLKFLERAGDGATAYGKVLADASGDIARRGDGTDMQSIIATVLSETRNMQALNRNLEGKLAQSVDEIAALRESLEASRREAMTDALTGIANRKSFDMALRQAAKQAMETGEPMSLLLLDIDHFKKFNDTHGHQLGDQVLKLVARALNESIKGRDLAARYGGEEFAIILPRTEITGAAMLAEQVRGNVASKSVYRRKTDEDLGSITLSIGVAEFRPGEPLHELVQRSDEALYGAKQVGRNRVVTENQLQTLKAVG